VDWGLNQATESSPYLLVGQNDDGITGQLTDKLDFRHTVALAILMVRSGLHRGHQKHYLKLVLEGACNDGGWPAEFGSAESNLPATVYAVEFLANFSKSSGDVVPGLDEALRLGQDWIILAAKPDGGWATEIFPDKPLDRLWSTAYLLQRLFAAGPFSFPEWTQSLIDATASLLRGSSTVKYKDELLRLRVEARVAAALALALQVVEVSPLLRERAEAWLHEWQGRFLNALLRLPFRECDLATATFATRALLYGKNYREVGDSILDEVTHIRH
jgi:hypothetical protein